MANITKYLEKRLLTQSVGQTVSNPNWHVATYIGLFITMPTADWTLDNQGNSVEVYETNGYLRKPISWNTAVDNVDLSNSSKITNASSPTVQWTATGGFWKASSSATSAATVVGAGIFDSNTKSTGNLLWFGELSAPVTLAIGDTLTIEPETFTLTLA